MQTITATHRTLLGHDIYETPNFTISSNRGKTDWQVTNSHRNVNRVLAEYENHQDAIDWAVQREEADAAYRAKKAAEREAAKAEEEAAVPAVEETAPQPAEDKATPKQVAFLRKLVGRADDAFFLHIPADLTTLGKREASALIDALLKY